MKVTGSWCPPGAWVGDPREPEVSEAHLPPPRQARSHLALETQQGRAWLVLNANLPSNCGPVALPRLSFPN